VLIGALPHSGRWRGWLAESTDQPHLVEGRRLLLSLSRWSATISSSAAKGA
jgi:hypothetical protein